MTKGFLRVLFFLLSPLPALAGGSVDFKIDIEPLLRPELSRELEGIEFPEPGSGHRIGPRICPALAGRRIGSYHFRARDSLSGRMLSVVLSSHVRFLDENRNVVAEKWGEEWRGEQGLERAVSLHEYITAVSVRD